MSEPEIWGPHVWAAIHLIAMGAPESFNSSTQGGYRNFFGNLPYVLPCIKCQEHLLKAMEELPLDMAFVSGRKSLFKWTVDLHNAVNARLGKPLVSYEDAERRWSGATHNSAQAQKNHAAVPSMTIVFIAIAFLLFTCYLLKAGRRKS